jgi:thioredoxin-dependent peroxiredoxin
VVVQEGTAAPEFELTSHEGKTVKLSDFRGQAVVLYFYPKDDTPGCTKQACGFRDAYGAYEERGVAILGVSADGETAHVRFREKYGLPFTLLSDPDRTTAKAYDVWRETTMHGEKSMGILRSTFVIDAEGTVVRAMYGVKPEGHADNVLAGLEDH